MNKHVATLMQKEVSRKEFLGMSGLALASVFGLGTIVKLLSGQASHGHLYSRDYGASVYGGKKV